jgi:hypothetical protein
MLWGATVRERLLTQHFLERFLENDLLSPDADHHQGIALVCGGLLTLGLFLSVFSSLKFLFMPFQSPGRTAVLAVGDRLVFVTLAMIVLAFVAVATWEALSLDPRDTAILGPLPIERAVLARAKLRAIAILAGSFSLVASGLSSLFHPTLMVAKLPIGMGPALALIVVHLLVTLGAGLFGFGSVLAVREILRATLGWRFTRVSTSLQAVLIVILVTSFLLLPAILSRARTDSNVARLLPSVWFVGLQEALAGPLVADLPRGVLPPAFAAQEDRAAARYREAAAWLRPLAWRAVAALTIALGVAVAAYFWNCRSLPLPLVGHRAVRYHGPRLLTRAMMLTTLRNPAMRAGFFFTVHCLFRSGPHRVVMAGCTAVSLALSTVLLGAGSRSPAADLWGIPVYVFATQTISLAVMLFGFVHVTRLPADVTANRLFRIAWIADGTRFVAGVRRAALIAIVLPVVLMLLPPCAYLMGWRFAMMHALTGIVLGAALLTVLMFGSIQLPLVATYAPSDDLSTVGPVVLIGGMIAALTFARIERFALADTQSAAMLWIVLALVAVLPHLLAGRNTALDLSTAFDVPAPGTTRLDLG